jgi:hypothetical protein
MTYEHGKSFRNARGLGGILFLSCNQLIKMRSTGSGEIWNFNSNKNIKQ